MIDDFCPPTYAEINIDVRHRNPFRIKKTLKEQVVLQGINVGDAETESDQRAGGRAPTRTNRDAVLLRIANKVPYDQKIAGVPHPLNDFDLVRQACLVLCERMLEFPFGQFEIPNLDLSSLITVANCLLEVFIRRQAWVGFRNRIVWEVVDAFRQRQVTRFGDLDRAPQSLGKFGAEDVPHLIWRSDIEVRRAVSQAVLVADCFT